MVVCDWRGRTTLDDDDVDQEWLEGLQSFWDLIADIQEMPQLVLLLDSQTPEVILTADTTGGCS